MEMDMRNQQEVIKQIILTAHALVSHATRRITGADFSIVGALHEMKSLPADALASHGVGRLE